MNTCTGTIKSIFEELYIESYQIKDHAQKRFKDITIIIKTHPGLACVSCLVLAGSIYSFTCPVFFALSILVLTDYLDHTYFYTPSSPRSLSLFALFAKLNRIEEFQPLSTQEREELLVEDPKLENYYQKTLEEQEAYKNDTRPILLVLKAKSDYNGALNLWNQDDSITINGNNNIGVKELKKKYKIVVINDISHTNQIKEGLEKITNTIQQVWVLAHGTPTSMLLEGKNKIRSKDLDDLSNLMQQKISKDAHIVLFSCSTGQKISSGENIATKFSRILPGRTIWAPTLPTGTMTLDLGEEFSIKISFWRYKSRLKFLKEKLENISWLRPFRKIETELNVTVQIKDGDLQPIS